MARRKRATPSVATIKAQVRARDNHTCTKCGMTRASHLERYGRDLEVHRIVPGSRYSLNGCVTLCRSCHQLQPKRQPGQPDLAYPNSSPKFVFYLEQAMLDALDNYRLSLEHDPGRSQVVRDSLREFLKRKGFFPPPASP